jgi:hypothetical protein
MQKMSYHTYSYLKFIQDTTTKNSNQEAIIGDDVHE